MRVVLLVILMTITAQAKRSTIDRVEAAVNADIILLSDVIHFRKTSDLRAQLDPLFSGSPIATRVKSSADKEVVDFLINEQIIAQKFPVKDAAVEKEISNIQAANQFGREALIKALREQGYGFDDYFELIRLSISKRNLIDRDIRTKVFISENDIKNFFYNSKISQTGNRSYRVKLITISRDSFVSAQASRQAAQAALDALKAGESFEEVAKRSSDAPSAPQGGDLGFLNEDDMSPIIRKQLSGLKVGQYSKLITAAPGSYLIVKLADIKSGQEDRLDKMRDQIRNQLSAKEYQRQITFWLERERQKSHIKLAGKI